MTALQKINSLRAAANETTGQQSPDLTDAIQKLIDGYGQGSHSPTISVAASGLVTATCGGTSATHQLSSSDDTDFIAENIKDGVTLFGLLGTLSGGGGLKITSASVTSAVTDKYLNVPLPNTVDPDNLMFISVYCSEIDTTPIATAIIALIFVKQRYFFNSPFFTRDYAYLQLTTGNGTTTKSGTGGLNTGFISSISPTFSVLHNNRNFISGKTYQVKFYETEE